MAALMKRVSLYRKSVRGKFSSGMESSSTCTWVLLHVVTQLSLSTNLQPGKCIIWCFPWSDHCAYISSADTLDVTQCTLDVSRSPWQERCVFDCVTSMRHAGWGLRDAHCVKQWTFLFSQYRSCDDSQEVWTFVVFIKKTACEQENVQLWKKMLSWVSSRSVSGKQNRQATKVYWQINEWE